MLKNKGPKIAPYWHAHFACGMLILPVVFRLQFPVILSQNSQIERIGNDLLSSF